MERITNTADLVIKNIDSLPKGTGCKYLECIRSVKGELVAKQWRRKEPKRADVIVIFGETAPIQATCQNCGKSFPVDDLKPIKDIFQRVAPGETMPAGECPECGALCSLDDVKDASARVAPGLPANAAYYIAEARKLATDELEIDDTPEVSPGDGGAFVAAWVWIPEAQCKNCDMPTGNIGEVKPGLCNLCAVAEGEESEDDDKPTCNGNDCESTEVQSTYCGSFCGECLAEHVKTCEVCANDFA